ncbi:MAG: phage tail tape measure protein [Proteobacteria bacterium]|nr:phage tail tape measure protein [Pseudomonadota bacterium]MBU1742403.1 phage tail tape measure protein [Pseudomonadota bacterium]
MKRVIFLAWCLVLVGSANESQAISYRNEPRGFRGLKWSARSYRISGLKYVKTDKKTDKKTMFTPTDAVQALYSLGLAGFSIKKAIKMLIPIIDLATAESTSLSMAGEMIAGTMKTFKLRPDETRRVVDLYTGAISASKLSMERLSESIKYVAKVFARLKYSEEDMVVALAVAAEAGVFGFQAGNSWRTALMSLVRPSMLAYKSMVALKMSIVDIHKKMLPIPAILEQFRWGLQNVTTRKLILNHLVNIFGLESLPVVLKGVEMGINGWARLYGRIIASASALEKAQAKREAFRGRTRASASAMERLHICTGTFPIKSYVRPKDSLKIGLARVKSIQYKFAYKRLMAVEIWAYGSSDVQALHRYIKTRFGFGSRMPASLGGGLGWLGYKTTMFLKIKPTGDVAQFVMVSPRIMKWATTRAKRR